MAKMPLTPKTEESQPLDAAGAALSVGLPADGILDWRDYGTHITVVTVDGRKLRSDEVTGADEAGAQ